MNFRRIKHLLTSFLCLFLLAFGNAEAEQKIAKPIPPIEQISKVRWMNVNDIKKGLPVLLEGQIVRLHPDKSGFFLYDGANGIYVKLSKELRETSGDLQLGDFVKISGVSDLGDYSPAILANDLTVLKNGPLPDGRLHQHMDQISPSVDCDWVLIKGRLISMERIPGGKTMMLEVVRDDMTMNVEVPFSEEDEEIYQSLMFKWVRFHAVIGTIYNERRQSVRRIFYGNGAETFEEAMGVDDLQKPMRFSIDRLMTFKSYYRQEVIIQGVVTFASGREIYIRDNGASTRVTLAEPAEVKVGDFVELTGLVWPHPLSPAFRARSVEVLESGELPEPVLVDSTEILNPIMNWELVEIDAEILDRGKIFTASVLDLDQPSETLLCRSGDLIFEAYVPPGIQLPSSFERRAIVRLTGICSVFPAENNRWKLDTEGLRLDLRGPQDAVLLHPAPWWTQRRLRWATAVSSGVILLFLAWNFSLRRRVNKQTAIISEKVERETILDERQRIARELHDNLEQGLAGAVIQLGACRKLQELNQQKYLKYVDEIEEMTGSSELKDKVDKQAEDLDIGFKKTSAAIDIVEHMLSHCSAESRTSILELRGGLLERMDLVGAIRETVTPLATECGAELSIEVEGQIFRMKRVVERNLLLAVKEASTNAARHAKPKKIIISVIFKPDELQIKVKDDGCGFTVNALPKSGRFGLMGMHERINKVKGKISVESEPGKGATVSIVLPISEENLA